MGISLEFHWINFLVLFLYCGIMLGVGAYFARNQETSEDYLLAGRSMGWLPIAVSVMATAQSAISYLGQPAWTYQHDMTLYVVSFAFLLAIPVLNYVFLPFFSKLKVFTAYEYLERRFCSKVRFTASALFLISQGLYLGVVIYAPALVFSLITGSSLVLSILVMAGVTILYTSIGGMKAVMWGDVIQFCVMVGGVVLAVAIILGQIEGGFSKFWEVAQSNGKLQIFGSAEDVKAPLTFWGTLIGGFFSQVAFYGTNQTVLQRYLTTDSLAQQRKALLLQAAFFMPYLLVCMGLGPLLFVFYRLHPTLLDPGINIDNIFAYFIVKQLPVGVAGVVIAGIFAAAMSTYASTINSLATVSVQDFYRKYVNRDAPAIHYVKVARAITLLWGVYSAVFALFCEGLGSLAVIDLKVLGPLSGVLLGIFLLGMLSRRANTKGTLWGVVLGCVSTYSIAFFTQLSFMWYTAVAFGLTFVIGYLASLLDDAPENGKIDGLVLNTSET